MADMPNAEKTAFLSQLYVVVDRSPHGSWSWLEERKLNPRSSSAENEDSDRATRRITALLTFASMLSTQLVGKSVDQEIAQAIVLELVKLSASSKAGLVAHTDVPHALQVCLMGSTKLLSAEKFLDVVRRLAETDDQEVSLISRCLGESKGSGADTTRISSALWKSSQSDCHSSRKRSVSSPPPPSLQSSADLQTCSARQSVRLKLLSARSGQLHYLLCRLRIRLWRLSCLS